MANFKHKKSMFISWAALAAIVSCSGFPTSSTPTSLLPTPTILPTQTLQIIVSTKTPIPPPPSRIPPPTPTHTPTATPYPECPDLSARTIDLEFLQISLADIPEADLPYISDYFRPPFRVFDTTGSLCSGECVSRTWHGDQDLNVLSLTLIRVENDTQAREVIASFFAQLGDLAEGHEYKDERDWIDAPIGNTRIVLSDQAANNWLTTHRCGFVILLTLDWRPPSGARDYNAYDNVVLLTEFVNAQIRKLAEEELIQ